MAVYRLFLAADDLAEEDRAAANERLEHWRGLAASGKVRLGTAWVARDAADPQSVGLAHHEPHAERPGL